MPTIDQILQSLQSLAHNNKDTALAWHAILYCLLLLIFAKNYRALQKLIAIVLVILLFSVAAFAWQSANYFNMATFLVIGVILRLVLAGLTTSRR